MSADLLSCKGNQRERRVCAVGQQLPDNHKSQKDPGEPWGLQMVAFLEASEKLSPLSSEWGVVHSQPEALGPGRARRGHQS